MCFTFEDFDWTASICEVTEKGADKDCFCGECGSSIKCFDSFTNVFMQEDEECRLCAENADDPELTAEERVHTCDFGETWSERVCANCMKLRDGIRQRELKAGCPEWSSVPPWGMLRDELWEHGERVAYVYSAMELYPELVSHPIVADILEDETE